MENPKHYKDYCDLSVINTIKYNYSSCDEKVL